MCCHCLGVTCDCCCLSTIFVCRLSVTFVCRLTATFVCRHRSPTLICVKMIQTTQVYSICDKKINSMVVNILHNWNHRYSSDNSNIKCVGSTIKCISFEPIHYTISLDIVSSSMIFNDFDSIFLWTYH